MDDAIADSKLRAEVQSRVSLRMRLDGERRRQDTVIGPVRQTAEGGLG